MGQTNDTIAAIATARGRAALAIVRVSGPHAIPIVNDSFRGADLSTVPGHTVHVGHLVSRESTTIDQVVVTVFREPRSSTGEDVVEVSCHGGDLAPQLVLQTLLDGGARLADPGEFTQRAFINGKMDLAQAEAVANLIHASSSLAHKVSLSHIQGRYSDSINSIRKELLETCALVELELDFAEEDVEFADKAKLESLLSDSSDLLTNLLNSSQLGALVRDGVKVVIGGRPNAGKSTLLNALLGRERAIVSSIPGTTRDEIEAECEMEGLLFRFIDTAGLRDTADAIEAEGVRRTMKSIDAADLLLYVYDSSNGLDSEERRFLDDLDNKQVSIPVILVANKIDLLPDGAAAGQISGSHVAISAIQAMKQEGELDQLRSCILNLVAGDLSIADSSPVVINQRHRQHIARACEAVQQAREALDASSGGDTLALDLREALHELGAVTGKITTEDILGEIFSTFCIGK